MIVAESIFSQVPGAQSASVKHAQHLTQMNIFGLSCSVSITHSLPLTLALTSLVQMRVPFAHRALIELLVEDVTGDCDDLTPAAQGASQVPRIQFPNTRKVRRH